jgi:hypothetical protein
MTGTSVSTALLASLTKLPMSLSPAQAAALLLQEEDMTGDFVEKSRVGLESEIQGESQAASCHGGGPDLEAR